MWVCLYKRNPLSSLFQEHRLIGSLIGSLIQTLHAVRTPQMAPSSEDMPVEGRNIQKRPGIVVRKFHIVTQQMSYNLYLRQRPFCKNPVRNPHQELSRSVLDTIILSMAIRYLRQAFLFGLV